MKIDKKDYERLLNGLEKQSIIERKRITDLPKFTYWHRKGEEYIEAMNENRDNKSTFMECWRQAILCEFEKNKYQHISKKDWIMLLMMVKSYNANCKDNKLYMDKKGLRGKLGGFS
jgi:hypothetical protein